MLSKPSPNCVLLNFLDVKQRLLSEVIPVYKRNGKSTVRFYWLLLCLLLFFIELHCSAFFSSFYIYRVIHSVDCSNKNATKRVWSTQFFPGAKAKYIYYNNNENIYIPPRWSEILAKQSSYPNNKSASILTN